MDPERKKQIIGKCQSKQRPISSTTPLVTCTNGPCEIKRQIPEQCQSKLRPISNRIVDRLLTVCTLDPEKKNPEYRTTSEKTETLFL